MEIAEVLRQRRMDLGLSIADAARMGNVNRAYLSMIESGKRMPTSGILLAIVQALSLPLEEWLPAYLGQETSRQQLLDLVGQLYANAQYDAARKVLAKAYFLGRHERGNRYNTTIYHWLGRVCYAQKKYAKALLWFTLLERGTRRNSDLRSHAVALYDLAMVQGHLQRHVVALGNMQAAEEAFARLHLPTEAGSAAIWRANLLYNVRAYPEARRAYHRAAYFLRGKDYYFDALLGEGIATSMTDGPAAAIPTFLTVVNHHNVSHLVRTKGLINLAVAYRKLQRYEEADRLLDAGMRITEDLPSVLHASFLTESAICRMYCGDRTGALERLDEYKALQGPKDSGDIAVMATLAVALGVEPPIDPIPPMIQEDHEQRFAATMALLAGRPIQ